MGRRDCESLRDAPVSRARFGLAAMEVKKAWLVIFLDVTLVKFLDLVESDSKLDSILMASLSLEGKMAWCWSSRAPSSWEVGDQMAETVGSGGLIRQGSKAAGIDRQPPSRPMKTGHTSNDSNTLLGEAQVCGCGSPRLGFCSPISYIHSAFHSEFLMRDVSVLVRVQSFSPDSTGNPGRDASAGVWTTADCGCILHAVGSQLRPEGLGQAP